MKAATSATVRKDETGKISIHAAREGGDDARAVRACFFIRISIHAAREGGDEVAKYGAAVAVFQSTPPVKAATYIFLEQQKRLTISIHAAREGGDWRSTREYNRRGHFNPRRP